MHLGPGDDAAVVGAPDGRVVATTDMLVEGRHFRRDWSSATDVGHKAATQNLADVAAMGAVPTALLVGLAVPADIPAEWTEGLADGLREECAVAGAAVVGGDLVRAESITLGVTALGDLQGRPPLTRGGARAGDAVAVAGRLGWSAAGLALLDRELDGPSEVITAHRRPRAPYAAGPQAARAGASALIDVSDGLVADLGHIAEASGVQVDIDSASVTPGPELAEAARRLDAEPARWVLTGGEDHALAAMFPATVDPPPPWTVIGCVRDGSGVTVDGEPHDLAGFDHFR